MKPCPACEGKGWRPIPWIKEDPRNGCKCERCNGMGKVPSDSEREEQMKTQADESDSGRWWITTELLARGGAKRLGPFLNRDLAIKVRTYVEKAEDREGAYWIDEDVSE